MSLIIECAGAPGSGKTTSCALFAQALRHRNAVVYGRSDLRMWLRDRNAFEKAMLFFKTLVLKTPAALLYLLVVLYSGIATKESLFRFVRLSFFEVVLQAFIKSRKPHFMLLDQWTIQDIWSATIFHKHTRKELAGRMRYFFGKRDLLVFFQVNATTASERISTRTTGCSRFDSMEGAKRQQALEQYDGYLQELFQEAGCRNKLVLDAQKQPGDHLPLFLYAVQQMEPATNIHPIPVLVSKA